MTMTAVDFESRVRAMEDEITRLKERLESVELENDWRISEAQFARGESMPAREALELIRRKHNIPKT